MRGLVIAAVLLAAACRGHEDNEIDDVVGETCETDGECAERCFRAEELPGGFCSLSCVHDDDCPDDTYCIAESGGVCMFACPPFECQRLGPNWFCLDRDRINGGTAFVCSGD